jgi:hypothetical protein
MDLENKFSYHFLEGLTLTEDGILTQGNEQVYIPQKELGVLIVLLESLVSFSSPNLQYHAYRPFHESAKIQCPLYTSHFYRDSMLLFNNHLPSILKLIPLMCR